MNKFSLWNCVGTGDTRGSKGAWKVERTCRDSVYNQMRERENRTIILQRIFKIARKCQFYEFCNEHIHKKITMSSFGRSTTFKILNWSYAYHHFLLDSFTKILILLLFLSRMNLFFLHFYFVTFRILLKTSC